MRDPHPGVLSSPRWPFGSPPEKRACCAGRIPAGDALPGSEPPRFPPGGRRRFRFFWKRGRPPLPRRRGNPGRCCNAVWMRAPLDEPRPGIRGRCAAFPPLTAEYLPPASGPSLVHRLANTLAFERRCIRSIFVALLHHTQRYASVARLAGAAHQRPRCIKLFTRRYTFPDKVTSCR